MAARVNRSDSDRKPSADQRKPVSRTTSSGKLSVPPPATFRNFFLKLVMHICRKIMLVDLRYKLGVYMVCVVCLSLAADLMPPFPQPGFAKKTSFLNVVFARWAWGWTLAALGPFVFFSSSTYCCGRADLVKRHMCRLGVATVWWFLCTSLFEWVEGLTGWCSKEGFSTKRQCRLNDGAWGGFDISGHAFLMIHNLLTIGEEIKIIAQWERIGDTIAEEENPRSPVVKRLTQPELTHLKVAFDQMSGYVRFGTILLTILAVVFEAILLVTVLYFHNMPQKVTGASFAAVGWVLTYQVWYKQPDDMTWSPGYPGKGLITTLRA